jgi:hypothetical protein
LAELLTMPAPLNVRVTFRLIGDVPLTVKAYAGALALNVKAPSVVLVEGLKLVTEDEPKKAVPVGTVAGVQFDAVLKSPEPGLAFQFASCACATEVRTVVANSAARPRRTGLAAHHGGAIEDLSRPLKSSPAG